MKICPVCKTELQDESVSCCPVCGTELNNFQNQGAPYAPFGTDISGAGIKAFARERIRGKIGNLFVISLIIGLITGALSFLCPEFKYTVGNITYTVDFLSFFVSIFVSAPFAYSMAKIYIGVTKDQAPKIEDAFFGFKDNYKGIVIMELWRTLYVFLWTLLFIIPGIIKTVAYSMSTYILYENPHLSPKEALLRSEEMMRGRKMEYFLLMLSFIGWILLGILTLGILYIWLIPYMQTTAAAYYNSIKQPPSQANFENNQYNF